MTTIVVLPFDRPPLTKNKVRRMHYQAEAKERAKVIETVRWAIRQAKPEPRVGAVVILNWRMATRRRQDGDGAAPTLAAAIDALVLERILPDDSWVCVPHSGITCHPPQKGQPGAMWLSLYSPDKDIAA